MSVASLSLERRVIGVIIVYRIFPLVEKFRELGAHKSAASVRTHAKITMCAAGVVGRAY